MDDSAPHSSFRKLSINTAAPLSLLASTWSSSDGATPLENGGFFIRPSCQVTVQPFVFTDGGIRRGSLSDKIFTNRRLAGRLAQLFNFTLGGWSGAGGSQRFAGKPLKSHFSPLKHFDLKEYVHLFSVCRGAMEEGASGLICGSKKHSHRSALCGDEAAVVS